MRKDLYELFIENAFGVDVDNDFKIRIFDPSASNIGLPDRLEILDVDKHTKYFLEGHFLWCLNARFHGGSIEDDPRFTRYEAEHFLARLSYAYDEDASEAYQLKAEDWETELGQAVLEFLTFKDPDFKIPEARVAADSESDSEWEAGI
uniref:Non-canonical non-ribosomal peptide synthetase FUB8 ) n=1 Tax=Ganoderma boninense TaxID=34458 RepID=A0A5K1K1A3_9APHY|nr:Non-canonical non-ribosomal peptide synthetase FUB8 (EC (Fusaric acid biosynthesis protein 8) [Ganoderma boninense]